MKRPWYLLGLIVLVFTAGLLSGAVLQKYYGFGTLLRTIGVRDRSSLTSARVIFDPAVHAQAGIPEEFSGKLSLFILAGQSNMSGRGDLPSEQAVHRRIFVFGNDYRWKIAREPIDAADGQVDLVSEDKDAGFGPGLAFATSLIKRNPDRLIGLIPCAKGASSIAEWQRNLSENSLYGSCLKRIRAATTMGKITGLLFFQGEEDAVDPNRAPNRSFSASSYAMSFSRFVSDIRNDLALVILPVVFAQIATNNTPRYFVNWHVIKEQQEMINLSCTAMIRTADLSLKDDVHFTTESYQIIGQRYAEAFLTLMASARECGKIS
jgi:Carbohydrate esterase, sialic acid-specific acetylesterase